jgi:SAM-dependent methyltransferase
VAARTSLWSRKRKLEVFLRLVRPTAETRVVDVGATDTGFSTEPGLGATHNFFEALYPWPERITAVSDGPLEEFATAFPVVERVVADGRSLPFADDEFDVAFSNAVLEHLPDGESQRRFVHELCRVAPRAFVSTPNRWFPIEPHTLVPFVHWLPRSTSDRVFRALGREAEWRDLRLLGPRDLTRLFPPRVRARIVSRAPTLAALAERKDPPT